MDIFNVEEFKRWKKEYEAERQKEREQQRLAQGNEAAEFKKAKNEFNSRNCNQFDKRRLFQRKIKELLKNVPDDSLENVFDEIKALVEKHSK